MTVTSPIVSTYSSRIPYLTPQEYIASPTGVDTGNLVPTGTTQQNADALVQTIARASNWVDTECRKVLAATLDTQAGRYRVRADGTIRVALDFTPILQITSVQAGLTPSTMATITDLSNAWIDRKVATIPLWGLSVAPGNPYASSDRMFAVVQYVNGYANCLLTAVAPANTTTLTVDSALGIVAGQQLTIYDPGSTEAVTVATVTGNTITLTSPTVSAHLANVAVSALPPAIKQATVLLTSALIKTRGDDAIVMQEVGQGTEHQQMDASGSEDVTVALELLAPYRRVA